MLTQTTVEIDVQTQAATLIDRPARRIGELLTQLKDDAEAQQDMRIRSREISIAPDTGHLSIGNREEYSLSDHAFGQLCNKFGVPTTYAARCEPELLSQNLNHWLHDDDRELLIRTDGSGVRAVLSNTYREINHVDVLGWLAQRLGDDVPIRYELTEKFLDVQVVKDAPEHGHSDRSTQGLHRGVHVRNSEVGSSKVMISALVYRAICLNGLVLSAGKWGYARRHVGSSDISGQVRAAFDKALSMSTQAVGSFLDTQNIKVSEPEKAIDVIAGRYELSEGEAQAVQFAFTIEPAQNLYATINAVTRAANDASLSVDSRHKLQELGGKLTDLSSTGKWID